MKILENKLELIKKRIAGHEKVAIAYSGGLASSILLKLCDAILGSNCLAVTITSPFLSTHALDESKRIAKAVGARQAKRDIGNKIIDTISHNSKFRYYHYMREVLAAVKKEAGLKGIGTIMVGRVYSAHPDHLGFVKAIQEFSAKSPLEEEGIVEEDLDILATMVGLEVETSLTNTFLASRIPYGIGITRKLLENLDKAEQKLHELDIHYSRLSLHNSNTLILESDHRDLAHIIAHSDLIKKRLGKLFKHLDVRLEGFT